MNHNGVHLEGMILDMDGVIWRGKRLLPGVQAFLHAMHVHAMAYIFATNNSTSTAEEIAAHALQFGLHFDPKQILTSSLAAVSYMQSILSEGSRVFVLGESGLITAIEEAGYEIHSNAEDVEAVIVGLDRKVNWDKLSEACYAIAKGAKFIGTNMDPSLPTERGIAPGNGAILGAIEHVTGVAPVVLGKPEPYLYLKGAQLLGLEPESILVVGDRLETDIEGGKRARMATALLLTGISSLADVDQYSSKPDFVYDSMDKLKAALWH